MSAKWLIALSISLFSTAGFAQQWEAKCVDGKNLHYLQTINGDGYLYLTVTTPNNNKRVFPYARVRQTMYNGTALCGEIVNGLKSRSNQPVSQFCINQQLRIVYMKYQDPLEQRPQSSGKFCDATVIVR